MFGLGKKKNADDPNQLNQPIPAGWRIADLGLLGSGGMSRVYRVRDDELEREVALKLLRPELIKEDEALDRFIEEAKITAQLDHPNIPPVYALATDKKRSTCFTMKVLEGQSLQELLMDPKNKSPEGRFKALEVLVRVCDAVAFAHERGIFHCDLKPHNVMVAEHGQIYVVDWGLARRKAKLPAVNDDSEGAIGTPAYMAPEQARGENWAIDPRTDVYLLGGILYRILTGRPPFVASTAEATLELAAKGDIVPPDTLVPKATPLPRRLVHIALKALARRPDDRYPDVAAFRADLEDFIRGTARLPERTFQAGEVIIREGEQGDCAYIILDGHCQANRVVAGKTEMLRLMGPGEMFGEAAVLTNSPRLATVTAMMETTVAVVDRIYLEEEMQRTSLMALAIRTVATSFLDLNGQTAALLQEQTFAKAVDLCMRELALRGEVGPGPSRAVPWSPLLAKLAAKTRLEPAALSERVARQAGFQIDTAKDLLTLTEPRER
ncbi:MAG: protein kinase [Archangiaceae bacterium]|nr:protein kinase [Archangiaceae bacterium]